MFSYLLGVRHDVNFYMRRMEVKAPLSVGDLIKIGTHRDQSSEVQIKIIEVAHLITTSLNDESDHVMTVVRGELIEIDVDRETLLNRGFTHVES